MRTQTHKDVPGWFDFENIYDFAIDNSKNGDTLVEVGSFLGKSACYMMEKIGSSGKELRFYCVDLFTITTDEGDGAMPWGENAKTWQAANGGVDALYLAFLKNISNNTPSNLTGHFREDSSGSAAHFEDNSVHFCFIDASHLYGNVKKDLNAWYPKIKPGGFLAGHDFGDGTNGVGIAVKEFCAERNLEFRNDYSFIFQKPYSK